MPPDQDKWGEMPKWLANVYRMAGQQMRLTAGDLITDVIKVSGLEDSRLSERPESRTLGYHVVAWMLQPLAAEYLLKSLSIRDAGGFSKTHDLLKLFESLDRSVQNELGEQGAQQGIAIPGFLA